MRLALSACLTGQRVRYDGADKFNPFAVHILAQWLELIPICPEVEIGMGVPRPPIELVETNGRLRAVGVADARLDVTRDLTRFAGVTVHQLADIDGYIFKARSPSCAVSSTPVKRSGARRAKGAGLFAACIMRALPLLPVVEETALVSSEQQVNFIQRVEAYRRWRRFAAQPPSVAQLKAFHRRERLSLLAHGARGLRRMDAWLANLAGARLGQRDLHVYGVWYARQFTYQATRRRHVIVLRRVVSHCRSYLNRPAYLTLKQMVDAYARGEQPLAELLSESRPLWIDGPLAEQSYLLPSLAFRLDPR
ncbi:hypothetical protein Tel_13175 [Candidatus Tenderia electrophaga]|uniref:Uncharacterized protein n=1 Tax=Candidatus Tenderia electrophaga TaxID=1748243 RepID=A0A0S2TFQ9_9GAMM|nr:hypothetical protein Tel_13175 [Candidatus Tenderia electrophaga]